MRGFAWETFVWETNDGKLAMTRCPKCRLENYCLAVLDGICAWCGYKATNKDLRGDKK